MKGTHYLFTFIVIFCVFILNISAQEEPEKNVFADLFASVGQKKLTRFPNRPVVLPEGVTALQYCITCRVVAKELMNRLGYQVRPAAVSNLLI